MKLTDPARDAILEIMQRQELDPSLWYLEFRLLENGAIGLGFTQQSAEQVLEFGDLKLTVEEIIDTEGVFVDYGQQEGKEGFFFGPEEMIKETNECCGGGSCGDCGDDCECDGSCGENCKCKS